MNTLSAASHSEIKTKRFWSNFIRYNWEKKPAHFKNAQLPILQIKEELIFKWLVKYSEHCKKTKTAVGIKFYIDGESQYQNEVLQALPTKSDKSFLGYHQRMSALFPDYCLVCDELIQVSGDTWNLLGDFTRNLYEKVGLPNRQAEVGLYLGNYKKTPFGVHVDGCGVFSIPIVGEKKFRLWTSTYVQKNPDLEMAFDYAQHLKKSTVITATPGDLTYWPSNAWHIAESHGAFNATWSLGIWVDKNYHDVVLETLQPLLLKKLKSDSTKKWIPFAVNKNKSGEIKTLPKMMQRSVKEIATLAKNEVHDLFIKKWLALSSTNGFKSVPLRQVHLDLKMTDTVHLTGAASLVWAKLSCGQFCLASHGKLFFLKNSKQNLTFLKVLNSGNPLKVSCILSKSPTQKGQFEIVLQLYQMGRLHKTLMPK